MKSVLTAAAIGVCAVFSVVPAHALQDGRQLYLDCTRGNAFSEGYCEGFVAGVHALGVAE